MAVVAAPTLLRAQELTLQEAKQHGWVGEQSDGYLGLVTQEAPAAARDLVKRINARRTDIYAGIAKQEGISVVAVAVRSGQRLIGESAPGEWVWENGGWHQRGS
jgi:hypothetical protein